LTSPPHVIWSLCFGLKLPVASTEGLDSTTHSAAPGCLQAALLTRAASDEDMQEAASLARTSKGHAGVRQVAPEGVEVQMQRAFSRNNMQGSNQTTASDPGGRSRGTASRAQLVKRSATTSSLVTAQPGAGHAGSNWQGIGRSRSGQVISASVSERELAAGVQLMRSRTTLGAPTDGAYWEAAETGSGQQGGASGPGGGDNGGNSPRQPVGRLASGDGMWGDGSQAQVGWSHRRRPQPCCGVPARPG
jgi:hypothetical protein